MMQQGNGADGRYLPPAVGMDYSAMEAAAAVAAAAATATTTHPSHHHPHHHHGLVDPPPHLHYGLAPPPAAGHLHHLHHHPHQGLQLQQPQSSVGLGGVKRNADSAGLDMMAGSDSDEDSMVDVKPSIVGDRGRGSSSKSSANDSVASSKKTRGRVKIKMEFIDNKLRRYTTFSKRKTGIMKKAYELSTLTGTQVMLLVASETGHVYTFATRKLQPMITSDAGKALIQTCLNSPDPPGGSSSVPATADQRMSATGYEETELTYNVPDDVEQQQQQKVRQMMYAANSHYSSVAAAAAAAQQQQQQHQHNLFSGQSSPNGGGGGGLGVSMQHYGVGGVGHPAPSPSPSAMHHSSSSSYGGLTASLSPGLSSSHSPGTPHLVVNSHSPPFALPPHNHHHQHHHQQQQQQQQHPVAGR